MKTELGKYDPYKLNLVPRECVMQNFKINDEEYKVKVVSKPKEKQKLSKDESSKIIAIALSGALALGVLAATINLTSVPTKAPMEEAYVMYKIPAFITEAADIIVKVFPDGSATALVNGEEVEIYNGEKVVKLVGVASEKGMLYRMVEDIQNGKSR